MRRIAYTLPHTIPNGSSPMTMYTLHDHALVISNSNPKRNGHYVSGGGFYVRHREVTIGFAPEIAGTISGRPYRYKPYIGGSSSALPIDSASSLQNAASNGLASASVHGATGWKRARPGNPVASVSNFLIELRDLPTLPLRLFLRLKSLRAAGSEYLNIAFGWIPFLNDVKKMYRLYKTIDKRLAQIVRDNGNGIHRRRLIKDESAQTNHTYIGGGPYPYHGWGAPPSTYTPGWGQLTKYNQTREKVWFVGKFRYYIPDIGSSEWTKRATRALYGANVTPEVLWNALPWSWLIDWFGNLGDVVSNLSSNAVDNLTADYAYIMRETESSLITEGVGHARPSDPRFASSWDFRTGSSGSAVARDSVITRSRSPASPFGFGITFDGLSTYQLGIAAALGISRWA